MFRVPGKFSRKEFFEIHVKNFETSFERSLPGTYSLFASCFQSLESKATKIKLLKNKRLRRSYLARTETVSARSSMTAKRPCLQSTMGERVRKLNRKIPYVITFVMIELDVNRYTPPPSSPPPLVPEIAQRKRSSKGTHTCVWGHHFRHTIGANRQDKKSSDDNC